MTIFNDSQLPVAMVIDYNVKGQFLCFARFQHLMPVVISGTLFLSRSLLWKSQPLCILKVNNYGSSPSTQPKVHSHGCSPSTCKLQRKHTTWKSHHTWRKHTWNPHMQLHEKHVAKKNKPHLPSASPVTDTLSTLNIHLHLHLWRCRWTRGTLCICTFTN